jgi:hypothetical protein
VLEVLEDPRFPGLVARVAARGKPLPAWDLDWPRLLAAWFPTHVERARAVAVLQRVLFSPTSPWHQVLTAPPLMEALHRWQELGRRPFDIVTKALDSLVQSDPLGRQARSLLDGLVRRIRMQ